MPSKKWMIKKSLKEEWWVKKRGLVKHKRTKQKGKINTNDLLPRKVLER